jgi:phosphoglycolate phosphatase
MNRAQQPHSALRLAVFDVDGTLVDSQHNIVAAMRDAFLAHGLTPPAASAIRRIIGLSLLEAVAQLLPDGDEEACRGIAAAYKDGFVALRQRPDHHEPLFPGAAAALSALEQQGWLLAVATGKSRRGLLAMIERHQLQGNFVSLQTADDNPGKPHPAMLRRAIAEAGTAADLAVMIGDTSFDMQMGRAAGARAIGVAWGYHPPEDLLRAGAERVVASYDELLRCLAALFDRPV